MAGPDLAPLRPVLTLAALGKMAVLARVANVCYCLAYGAEFLVPGILSRAMWRRFRLGVLVLGMPAAIVLENYWIAGEIYPDVPQQAAAHLAGGANPMRTPAMASNINFPAPWPSLVFWAPAAGCFSGSPPS